MNTNRKLDLIAGFGFMIIAAAIIFVAIPYGVQEPKKVKFAALNPSYYPRLVCYCLLLFGAMLVVSRSLFFVKNKKANSEAQTASSNPSVRLPLLITITAVLLLYYLTLSSLGFIVSSSVALIVLLLLAGERNWLALGLIPLLVPISIYGFFTKVANIPIPAGILEPLLVG